MSILRSFVVLLALVSPALAQDGAYDAAAAGEAAKAFRTYIDGVTKKRERPDLTRPEVAALLGRIFDVDALAALPPAQAGDMDWLMDWTDAANTTHKLLILYGAKPGSQPDLVAIGRNMSEFGDQYAAALNFLIRATAREAVATRLFWAELAPEQRTKIREQGLAGFRSNSAAFIMTTVCAAIQHASRPANARLVASALRDTREVWASFLLPQDRAQVIAQLADLPKWTADEVAQEDLAAFTTALQAVN